MRLDYLWGSGRPGLYAHTCIIEEVTDGLNVFVMGCPVDDAEIGFVSCISALFA